MEAVVFAAERFGFFAPFFEVLTDGLIHKTYKVTANNKSVILQQVNNNVFKKPEQVVHNYQVVYKHLEKLQALQIPEALKTKDNTFIWVDAENSHWRAFEYIPNTYTEGLPATPEKIFSAAKCYGEFTKALSGVPAASLSETIPGFHNLDSRYQQLQYAIKHATAERLASSKELLRKIEERKNLVDFYNALRNNPEFRLRAMHHDCKLSNILFDKTTQLAVCPIDLDTVMPGYFFSDVGDMIRSMISDKDENAPAESVSINKSIYQSIISGYQSGLGTIFTDTENKYIHHSGMLMLYMQAIRFLADYLSNDTYYKIDYPEQNFNRALNQITLLEKLEDFLKTENAYPIK
jgi:Ser/Thr protein kinase RdoA (MazF antagonist)